MLTSITGAAAGAASGPFSLHNNAVDPGRFSSTQSPCYCAPCLTRRRSEPLLVGQHLGPVEQGRTNNAITTTTRGEPDLRARYQVVPTVNSYNAITTTAQGTPGPRPRYRAIRPANSPRRVEDAEPSGEGPLPRSRKPTRCRSPKKVMEVKEVKEDKGELQWVMVQEGQYKVRHYDQLVAR